MKNKVIILFNSIFFPHKNIEEKPSTKETEHEWGQKVKDGEITIPTSKYDKETDRLNEDEKRYLLAMKLCPDCKIGNLIEGPLGGMCINWYCDNCNSKFNLAFTYDMAPTGFKLSYISKGEVHLLLAQRIGRNF